MNFLVNASPKPFDIVTSNSVGHMMYRVLGNISCYIDPIMNFLANASPKPFDIVTSNSVGA